jgi:DNA gyrase subunit B
MTKEYTSKDITALSDFEHIRHTPEMYIGETNNPTHLIYEVIDNALDESVGGHANVIGLEINDKEHIVKVADNGRGIPFDGDTIELITTKLFSGGKFKKGKENIYKIACGTHGIGLVAVHALSKWMEVEIYRDKKHAIFRLENGKIVKKEITDYTEEKIPFSTCVTFRPDEKIFQTLEFDIKALKNRMMLASAHIEHLRLLLIHNETQEVIDCDIDDYFAKNLKDEEDKVCSLVVHLNQKIDDEQLDVRFCWCYGGKITARNLGSVNLLSVNQGTHINAVNEIIKDVLFEFAQKDKYKIQKNDCVLGLRCYTSLFMYEPKYASQTKERLAIRKEQLNHLVEPLKVKLYEYLKKNENFRNEVLNKIDSYRKKLSASEVISRSDERVNSRVSLTLDGNLKNCSSNDVSKCEIFICEGSSASGTLSKCRNPKYHAVMPLKGKVMNVCNTNKEFFKNKELVELINALGCGVESECDVKLLKYNKVVIAADNDYDGFHIATLLAIFFLKLMPSIIQTGHLYQAQGPLYGAQVKDKFIPFYDDEAKNKFVQENPNIKIQRYKGLGEMNHDQLGMCLINENTRRLFQIPYPEKVEDKDYLFELMIKAELKRELV